MAVRLGVSSPLVEHPRFPAIGSIGYWIHHTHTSPRSQTAWKMHVMFAVALSFFFFSPSCPESPISISIPCIMKSCQNMPHPGHWLWTDSWIVSQSRKWLAAHTHITHITFTPTRPLEIEIPSYPGLEWWVALRSPFSISPSIQIPIVAP